MKKFPTEFEALLSPEGRQVLAGQHPACKVLRHENFFTSTTLLDRAAIDGAAQLLSTLFEELLVVFARRLPAANGGDIANEEHLPKVGRMRAVPNTGPGSKLAQELAAECGLTAMVSSPSYLRFCAALAGRELEGPHTGQIFAYRKGDGAGPHTDHHPEDPRMRDGYVDVHLTFCSPGIREQFLVYERNGYFTEMTPIGANGTVTAYRLPVWHYTTPLQADSLEERRWLVLSSFYDV